MDLRMPRLDGIEATRRLAETHPEVGVVALTTYADDETVVAALQAGARGYLTKDAGAEQIRSAVERVAAGEAAIDPAVQRQLLTAVTARRAAAGADERRAARRPHPARGRGAGADRRRGSPTARSPTAWWSAPPP